MTSTPPSNGQGDRIPAINRLLAVPEVLGLVVEQLDARPVGSAWVTPERGPAGSNRQALSRLAQTCHSFCSPALDVLWRLQVGLRPLACTIPPVREAYLAWQSQPRDNEDNGVPVLVPTSPISRADVARFLEVYAPRVRHLCHGRTRRGHDTHTEAVLSSEIVAALIHYSPQLPALPCLRHLEWSGSNVREGSEPLLDHRLFLGLAMVDLSFLDLVPDERAERALADVPQLCPRLRSLDINWMSYREFSGVPRVLSTHRPGFFSSLTGLREIRIGHALPVSAFEEMRSLPCLEVLFFVPALDLPWDETPSYTPFPKLRELTLEGENGGYEGNDVADRCALVLTKASFPVLESVTIQAGYMGAFRDVVQMVKSHCSHTALETLHITREAALSDIDIDLDDITAEDIRPLYAFRNMRSFTLSEAYNVDLDDDDVLEMALAWPNLQSLSLVPMHEVMLGTEYLTVLEDIPPPEATMRALVHLAHHCPHLQDISIRISTENTHANTIWRMMFVEGPSSPWRVPPLVTRLALGYSLPAGDPNEVLASLATIFPRLIHLGIALFPELTEELEGPDAWTELYRQFELRYPTSGSSYFQALVERMWGDRGVAQADVRRG